MDFAIPVMLAAETPPAAGDGLTAAEISEATSSIFSVVGDTLQQICSEPVFIMFLVSGLIFMSVRLIRSFKRA